MNPNEIIKSLKAMGLSPYIANKSQSTTSVYVKFKDKRLKSLTIRDHKGRAKYKYKWNLVENYRGPNVVEDQGVVRFFYSEKQIQAFLTHIINYYEVIKKNENNDKNKRQLD